MREAEVSSCGANGNAGEGRIDAAVSLQNQKGTEALPAREAFSQCGYCSHINKVFTELKLIFRRGVNLIIGFIFCLI